MSLVKTGAEDEQTWDLTTQLAELLNVRVESAHPTPIRLQARGLRLNPSLQSTETQDGSDVAILIAR
jgi:hypothetical protein